MSTSNSWQVLKRVGHDQRARPSVAPPPEVPATEKVHVLIDDAPAGLASKCWLMSEGTTLESLACVGWFL